MNPYFYDRELERREKLAMFFRSEYGAEPEKWFSSPGRAEIVGGHTDHNLGTALVSALSCDILCAVSKRNDGFVEIKAEAFNPIRFSGNDLGCREREKGKSIALARGVLEYLRRSGYSFGGFSACTHSLLFRGAGVSSSASFEMLVCEIVNVLYLGGTLSPLEKAMAGKYAENVYFGKPCGLLDQAAIAYGGFHHIDFAPKEPKVMSVPTPKGYSLVLTSTGGSHAGLTPLYAEIKREMGEVASFFGKSVLRELSPEQIEEALPRLRRSVSDRAILRAFHFFDECDRADRAARALLDGNLQAFLRQIRESGESSLSLLQNCYVPGEPDQPVAVALALCKRHIRDGAYRMMGGGFAGTVLAFVREGEEQEIGRMMGRVFGRENVYYTRLRETGTCEIQSELE